MLDLSPRPIEAIAAILFAIAVVHTFSTACFERLARAQPRLARLWHPLGEIELVFALWAAVLVALTAALAGAAQAAAHLRALDFTEPLFVFAIMIVAASRPVLGLAEATVRAAARGLPLPRGVAECFVVLALAPLLGSVITEPAAMTLAALALRDTLFSRPISSRLRYAVLGVLFVNVSIGGTLTPFAAPPVLIDGGRQVGLGLRVHVRDLRVEGDLGSRAQCRVRRIRVPGRARAQGRCFRGRPARR